MISFCCTNPLPVDEVADGESGAAPAPGAEHRRHRRLRGEVPLVPAHPERAEGRSTVEHGIITKERLAGDRFREITGLIAYFWLA